jgi:putative transposase
LAASDHLHAIIKPIGDQTISSVLESFGSLTAHAILKHLKQERQADLLAFFAERQDKDAGKAHQIWRPIQAKNVTSIDFLREKLDYIHNNPVSKKWNLALERPAYAYSSTCYYDHDRVPLVAVGDIWEWFV